MLRADARVTAQDLRAHAAAKLARFEIPSRWWLSHDALPTNATGKVVKRDVTTRWPAALEVRT